MIYRYYYKLRLSNLLLTTLTLFFLFLQVSPSFAAEQTQQKSHFICLSDIHFDPFTSCKRTPCTFIQSLRQAPVSEWRNLFTRFSNQSVSYKQDTNFKLFQSALDAAKTTAETQQINFVLILGDFLAHDFRRRYKYYTKDRSQEGYQAFVKKMLEFITQEIQLRFANTDVYLLVGNNDTYHRDYSSQPNGQFFHDAAHLWSTLIKTPANREAMLRQFPKAGYYAFDAPNQSALRIIMLNSNLFSAKARGAFVDQTASDELGWLHDELLRAKAKQQKVIIAMHIPTGIDVYMTLRLKLFTLIQFWEEKYLKRFHAELEAFADEILGVFAGHIHSDWFQILTLNNKHEIPINGVPAISPIFGNNPGFKLYYFSPESLELQGYATYYFPFKQKSKWLTAYDFNKLYLPSCLNCQILTGMKLIHDTNHLAELYQEYYTLGTDARIKKEWWPYYWCAIRNFYSKDYQDCINKKN